MPKKPDFQLTPCPHCGEPPRYVLGTFFVRVDVHTGEKRSVGKPHGDGHVFECGGEHQWPAMKEGEEA